MKDQPRQPPANRVSCLSSRRSGRSGCSRLSQSPPNDEERLPKIEIFRSKTASQQFANSGGAARHGLAKPLIIRRFAWFCFVLSASLLNVHRENIHLKLSSSFVFDYGPCVARHYDARSNYS